MSTRFLLNKPSSVAEVTEATIKKTGMDSSIERIATSIGVSTRSLSRYLKDEGTTFKKIQRSLRVKQSKELLKTTDISIGEVACEVGLAGRRQFDRMFIVQVGETPAEYRKQHTISDFSQTRSPGVFPL
jgi:transcriptional regulator GlxA family with amidase domain